MLINRHNCVQCCIKHLASAAVIAREIRNGYNTPEYRFYFIGNLNEAQEQISGIDPKLSRLIRTLRLKSAPAGLDAEIADSTIRLLERIAQALDFRQKHGVYTGNPDETVRKYAGKRCRCTDKAIDILIPLRSDGSRNGNLELKLALRSIERNLTGFEGTSRRIRANRAYRRPGRPSPQTDEHPPRHPGRPAESRSRG